MDRAGAVRAAGTAGGRIWPVLALAVGLATVGGACAREADDAALRPDVVTGGVDFEATPAFLARASERSALEAYRVEARMTMRLRIPDEDVDLDVDVPFLAGEQDGDRYAFRMDMTEWLDELGGRTDIEATADMAGDGETLYLRGPLFAEVAEAAPPGVDGDALDDLGRLDGRWGRVDLSALGSSLAALQSSAGATGSDPRALLDLVASADDVTDLGTDEVDGTAVHGASGTLSLAEMLDAQGVDPDAYSERLLAQFRGDPDVDDAARLVETLVDGDLPLEVWIDAEGYVRRVAYEIDLTALLGGVDDLPEPLPEAMAMGTVMDFSDYGDESIEIELPTDAIDVTDAYRALLET